MADYRTPSWDGVQRIIDEERRRYLDSHIKHTSDIHEELSRFPTQFEEDVRIIYDELMSILLKKHKDYGPRNIADAPGGPINGLRVRIHDKVARINNLIDTGSNQPEYESMEDSFKDLANYAIIALLVMRDKWDK
jgi:hypothetical protein